MTRHVRGLDPSLFAPGFMFFINLVGLIKFLFNDHCMHHMSQYGQSTGHMVNSSGVCGLSFPTLSLTHFHSLLYRYIPMGYISQKETCP